MPRVPSMDMWTIFAIALAAMVVALVLAYVLKSRLSDDDVWQELVDPNAPAEDSESGPQVLPDAVTSVRAEEFPPPGVQPMSPLNSAQTPRTPRDAELRRSSRVDNPVPLIVLGTNRRGESFQERTSAVSFNLHGCRYSSRHDYPLEGSVTLQVTGTDGAAAPPVRARVRSVLSPQSPRELCQVGVELETPANIWGISTPPEDWQRVLGSTPSGARAATAVAPAIDPSSPPPSYLQRQPAPTDRRAEVTVFPSPVAPPPAPETPVAKESAPAKPERVTLTPEQLLHALQGKLQLAADRAVESALASRLDESVQLALTKIDDAWKANVRQAEEFSTARLAEVQNRWERELVVYRSRSEEISRRMEALAASTRQGLVDLQKFADRLKTEIEPQLTTRLQETCARASADFETKAALLSEQRLAQLTEFSQHAALQARSQLDEIVAEARLLHSAPTAAPAPAVTEERLDSLVNSAREQAVNRMEERLSDVWAQFEQQQDLARHRADEIAQHLEMLTTQMHEAKSQNEQSLAELRSSLATANANSAPERFDSVLNAAKEHIFNHLEWRLGEVAGRTDQQHNAVQQRADDLSRRFDDLAAETVSVRSHHEQGIAELRSLLAAASSSITQERLDTVINSVREQLLNHFEWRLGEISGQFQDQSDAQRQHAEELSQRLDAFATDMRGQLEGSRTVAENLIHELQSQNLTAVEQSVDRAAKEFETAAARISDRQLIRLMQHKQAMAAEASLELEARASETRALLQKAANTALDEFRRRGEVQIELIIEEATERVTSTLASLDAESRAACEARRRDVELQVARAADQSTAEFRSGIKAFLYSCLVAAVSAVDQHAQTTLSGLAKESNGAPLALEAPADSASSENRSSAAGASGSSADPQR